MFADAHEYDSASGGTLGGRISLSREAAGLTVDEAACHLGVLTESWSTWECDRGVPRANRLAMMAGLLGVSLTWLLRGVGAGPIELTAVRSVDLIRSLRQTSQEVACLNRRMQEIADALARLQHAKSEGTAA